jgi:60 kDa SS-A/Ro ribonucleoprotein
MLYCQRSIHRLSPDKFVGFDESPSLTSGLREDGQLVIALIEDVARTNRAPHAEPALFALATAASPGRAAAAVNSAALAAMPGGAKGVDLCFFVAFARRGRGWGRGLRTAIARWYVEQPVGELASGILRAREQNGWAHRDLLRMSHPKAKNPLQNALFQWAVEGALGHLAPPNIASTELRLVTHMSERVKRPTSAKSSSSSSTIG